MSRNERKSPDSSFSEQVKAAAGALKEARAVGFDRVVRKDGPRGYVVTLKDEQDTVAPRTSSRAPALAK